MGMVKALYSLNALSVELGRDRRSIAAALNGVPEDGMLKGHKAWHLTTALQATEPEPRRRTAGDEGRLGPLWHFASRLEA